MKLDLLSRQLSLSAPSFVDERLYKNKSQSCYIEMIGSFLQINIFFLFYVHCCNVCFWCQSKDRKKKTALKQLILFQRQIKSFLFLFGNFKIDILIMICGSEIDFFLSCFHLLFLNSLDLVKVGYGSKTF